MNKQYLKGLIIGLVIGMIISFISSYLLMNRYQIINGSRTANTNGMVKIDKLTGETWGLSLRNEKWIRIY